MRRIETKVAAPTAATALTAVLIALAQGFGIEVDPAVALTVATLIVAAVGYSAPHTFRPDLGDPPRGRHHADGGYSVPELAVSVGVFIVLIALAVFLFKGA